MAVPLVLRICFEMSGIETFPMILAWFCMAALRLWLKNFANHAAPGMIGKTHLAQALGYEAIKLSFRVLYRSIFDLVCDFLRDEAFNQQDRVLRRYLKPDLLSKPYQYCLFVELDVGYEVPQDIALVERVDHVRL